MFVLDSHCDTPTQMLRGLDIGASNSSGQVDISKLKAGCVDASFFVLYTPADMGEKEATGHALEMLSLVYDAVKEHEKDIALAFSPEEALINKEKGLVSIMIGMENGSPIRNSLSLLRMFYRLGVRYMTLTHNADNLIADAAAEGNRWHGLSPFGREVVSEMNRLGMIVDVAHVSDETAMTSSTTNPRWSRGATSATRYGIHSVWYKDGELMNHLSRVMSMRLLSNGSEIS